MENYAADALFLSPRKLSTFAKQRTAPFYLYDEAGIRAAAKALLENQPFNFKNKGNITKATSNWPDNPLIETGRLRNSVTYRIEKG